MKIPRISIHALMAVVLVIALDCMVIKAVSVRASPHVGQLILLLLATLPMAHVLAIGAAILARGPIRARPFLLGFVVGGGIAILASSLSMNRVLDGVDELGEGTRLVDWLDSLPDWTQMPVEYGSVIFLFLTAQLIGATICGGITRRWMAPRPDEVATRRRLAPSLVAVSILLVPALGIMGYLRWVVDPRELRRPPGYVPVVGPVRAFRTPSPSSKGSPLMAMDGMKVKVDRDVARCSIEWLAYPQKGGKYTAIERETCIVQVTVLEGDRKGESVEVPHCFLRPVDEPASPRPPANR